MTTVATEDQEQPNPSHERAARILDVTPGCRTSSGPAETRSAPKGRTYDRSRPSRSKHQIVLAIRGHPHMRWRFPVSCHTNGVDLPRHSLCACTQAKMRLLEVSNS